MYSRTLHKHTSPQSIRDTERKYNEVMEKHYVGFQWNKGTSGQNDMLWWKFHWHISNSPMNHTRRNRYVDVDKNFHKVDTPLHHNLLLSHPGATGKLTYFVQLWRHWNKGSEGQNTINPKTKMEEILIEFITTLQRRHHVIITMDTNSDAKSKNGITSRITEKCGLVDVIE